MPLPAPTPQMPPGYGTTYVPDNGAYQYAYTETALTGLGSAGADWPGLTITFTSDGVTAIELEAFCPQVSGEASATTSTFGRFAIYEGATLIILGYTTEPSLTGTNAQMGHILIKDTRVYSAGQHTVKVTCSRSAGGAGTVLFNAAAGFRAYLRSKLAHQ